MKLRENEARNFVSKFCCTNGRTSLAYNIFSLVNIFSIYELKIFEFFFLVSNFFPVGRRVHFTKTKTIPQLITGFIVLRTSDS